MPEASQQPLDIISDVMALSSRRNAKNLILIAFEVKGLFDEVAFRQACREALSKYPSLAGVLKELRQGWQRFLIRDPRPHSDVPVIVSELRPWSEDGPMLDLLLEHLRPRLDRDWQLMEELPLTLHAVQLAENRRALAIVMHHSAGDGAMTLTVFREILGHYDAIVKGRKPQWLEIPHVLSTSRKKSSKQRRAGIKDVWKQLKKNMRYLNDRPARPVGGGNPNNANEWHTRKVLSEHDSARILSNFSQGDLHVVDHLVACAGLALDHWNHKRNVPPATITSVVTVNMRGRFGGAEERNYSSAIFFRSSPDSRKDYLEFVSQVARGRSEQLQRRLDLVLRKSFSMGAGLFSVFPLGIRSRVAHAFMMHQRYSVAVGYMGVVFPDSNAGTGSHGSCVTSIGDLQIVDALGTGYKLAGGACMNLYAYIYCGQLQLVLTTSGDLLTEKENEALLDLVLDTVYKAGDLAAVRTS